MRKIFVLFTVILMFVILPAEKALAGVPSTYIYEGDTIIWKIKDIPAGRFPVACAVDVHSLCEKFNKL